MRKLTIEDALSDDFAGMDAYDDSEEQQLIFFQKMLRAIVKADPSMRGPDVEEYILEQGAKTVCSEWEHWASPELKQKVIKAFNEGDPS